MISRTILASRASLALLSLMICADAWAQCATYSSTDIANAINSSSTASAALKATACTWGGAGKSESGGNTCSSNGSNFGVLQLSSGNLAGTGYTAQQYLALPLQQQVNIWATQAGNSGAGSGSVATISTAAASGQSFGSTPATQGMAAACVQFGSVICKNDLAALNAGQPCGGANPVTAKYSVPTELVDRRRKRPDHLFLGQQHSGQHQQLHGCALPCWVRWRAGRDDFAGRARAVAVRRRLTPGRHSPVPLLILAALGVAAAPIPKAGPRSGDRKSVRRRTTPEFEDLSSFVFPRGGYSGYSR